MGLGRPVDPRQENMSATSGTPYRGQRKGQRERERERERERKKERERDKINPPLE
jgi:hypothetical protein